MDNRTDTPLKIEELEQKTARLEQQNAELKAKLNWYEEQFRLSQQKRFGASSEKTHPDQLMLDLFNEAEVLATPLEVLNDEGRVAGLKVQNHRTGAEETIPAERIYVAIGSTPNTAFLEGQLPVSKRGHLLVKPGTTETEIDGIFACGDVQDARYGQIASAVGSGCMAASDVERYLNGIDG
jgi:thioredoxin reductase